MPSTPAVKNAGRSDSPEELKSLIVKALGRIAGQDRLKDMLWKDMLTADRPDGVDRRALVRTLGSARRIVRHQASVPTVTAAWNEAIFASSAFVKAEKSKGRKGQKLFDMALSARFVAMQSRVSSFVAGDDEPSSLIADLEALTFEVNNFTWDGGFCKCGEPIPSKWRFCQDHYVRKPADEFLPVATSAAAGKRKKTVRHSIARAKRENGPVGGKGRKKSPR